MEVGNTVKLLVLNFSSVSAVLYCCCQPQKSMSLWRRLGKSVMLKIWSTAVTHTAASPPQPHRSYWLIWVCVWGGWGSRRLYWDLWHWHCCPLVGWPHLTLFCFPTYSLNHFLSFLFEHFRIFFFSPYTLPSNHLLLSPSPSSHYLYAKSSTISNHVLSITS